MTTRDNEGYREAIKWWRHSEEETAQMSETERTFVEMVDGMTNAPDGAKVVASEVGDLQTDLDELDAAPGYYEVTGVRVLYLDLDGTVRFCNVDDNRPPNEPDEVSIYPEVVALMRSWKESGGRIIAVTNQGGVGLGIITVEQCIATLRRTMELCEDLFDQVAFCQHHPDQDDQESAICWCRKPAPGLIVQATMQMNGDHPSEHYPVRNCLMIGDRATDHAAAASLNLPFLWADEWRKYGFPKEYGFGSEDS